MTEFGRFPSHSRLSARITAVSPGRISSISFHSKCGNARLPYRPAPDYAVARAHLACGCGGTHFCLGANLARVEAAAIVPKCCRA
jgi:hypothetical protein